MVSEYLAKNLILLDRKNHALYEEITEFNPADFAINYSELNTGTVGDAIEVIGVPLRKRKKEDILGSIGESEFRIQCLQKPGRDDPPGASEQF